jgi:Tfp pilus assembly protein PilV
MKKRTSQSGFTLVEAILATLVVSFGLVGFLITFSEAARFAVDSEYVISASHIANDQLEEIMSKKVGLGYDEIASENFPALETVTLGNRQYTKSVGIYEVDPVDLITASPGSGYKKIDVSITWGNPMQTVSYSAIVAEY